MNQRQALRSIAPVAAMTSTPPAMESLERRQLLSVSMAGPLLASPSGSPAVVKPLQSTTTGATSTPVTNLNLVGTFAGFATIANGTGVDFGTGTAAETTLPVALTITSQSPNGLLTGTLLVGSSSNPASNSFAVTGVVVRHHIDLVFSGSGASGGSGGSTGAANTVGVMAAHVRADGTVPQGLFFVNADGATSDGFFSLTKQPATTTGGAAAATGTSAGAANPVGSANGLLGAGASSIGTADIHSLFSTRPIGA
jgi:hypothetical protein